MLVFVYEPGRRKLFSAFCELLHMSMKADYGSRGRWSWNSCSSCFLVFASFSTSLMLKRGALLLLQLYFTKGSGCFFFSFLDVWALSRSTKFVCSWLLHLDCSHLLATPTWVDPNDSRQNASTPGLVFDHGLPGVDCFVVFDSSVKLTTMSCEKTSQRHQRHPNCHSKYDQDVFVHHVFVRFCCSQWCQ